MTDRYEHRLSEFVDGELTADERTLIERHLSGCETCAETLRELEAVATRAGQLSPREPATDLWPGIAARISAGAAAPATRIERLAVRFRRRVSLSVPQLAAAAVVLASVSGGLAWLAGSRDAAEANAVSGAPVFASRVSPRAQTVAAGAETLATADYYAASIQALESMLFDSTNPLPAETEARIRRALLIIDRAIEDARAALIDMPDDTYLKEHITSTMRRKSEFLRDAVRIAAQS